MASCHPKQGQIASLNNAVCVDRFLGIGGTAGIKPAMITQEGAEANLVAGDQKNQQAAH
jgi:hypothetical protein